MSDVRSAVGEEIGDLITTVAAGFLVTVLVTMALFLAAQILPHHRRAAAAMRVAGLLTALTALTICVQGHGWITDADGATMAWFAVHRSPACDMAATAVTDLGSLAGIVIIAAVCAALLSRRSRSVLPGLVLIGTLCAAMVTCDAIQAIISRPGPASHGTVLVQPVLSFPSTHVTGAVAAFGLAAFCAGAGRRPAVKALLASSALTGVLLIAAAHLYLGALWLTDVVAGALLGAAFVVVGAAAYDAACARSRSKAPGGGPPSTWHRPGCLPTKLTASESPIGRLS